MKKLTLENTEIRSQPHEMSAEGISDELATIWEIEEILNTHGYTGDYFAAWFDRMQGFYRWNCEIKKL